MKAAALAALCALRTGVWAGCIGRMIMGQCEGSSIPWDTRAVEVPASPQPPDSSRQDNRPVLDRPANGNLLRWTIREPSPHGSSERDDHTPRGFLDKDWAQCRRSEELLVVRVLTELLRPTRLPTRTHPAVIRAFRGTVASRRTRPAGTPQDERGPEASLSRCSNPAISPSGQSRRSGCLSTPPLYCCEYRPA
jgi:hypothetical protein